MGVRARERERDGEKAVGFCSFIYPADIIFQPVDIVIVVRKGGEG